jgi:TonB family protein
MKRHRLALILSLAGGLAGGLAVATPALAQQQQPIRVGGSVQAPQRTKYVAPVYPQDAVEAHVSGVVIAEALVGKDGLVSNVRILKSISLLDQAAIDAVQQWEYQPTLLNGQPVPVILTVTVNFAAVNESPTAAPAPQPAGGMQSNLTVSPTGRVTPTTWNGKVLTRIGGNVEAPERVSYVAPVYPKLALDAHVSGVVIVEAVVDETGNVAEAKVLKSIPLLDQAAIDAVLQWKYRPTLLNGAAVPVVMTVTLNFGKQ